MAPTCPGDYYKAHIGYLLLPIPYAFLVAISKYHSAESGHCISCNLVEQFHNNKPPIQ
jgi:hypothetical protein